MKTIEVYDSTHKALKKGAKKASKGDRKVKLKEYTERILKLGLDKEKEMSERRKKWLKGS